MGKQLDKALALHRAGDLAAAERIYEGVYRRDRDDSGAAYLLGVLRLTQGRDEEALQPLRRAVALAPRHFESVRACAEVLDRLGLVDEAVAMHRRAVALSPDDAAARLGLGTGLLRSGDAEAARERLEALWALRPDLPEAANNAGLALKALGRSDAAAAIFAAAIAAHPAYAPAPFNLGKMLAEQGDMTGAEPWLERALELAPGLDAARLALADVLHETGRTDDAVAAVDAVLASAPYHPTAAVWRCTMELAVVYADEAEVAARRARYAAALEQLAAKVACDPGRFVAGFAATRPFLLAYQGEDDRALQARYGALAHKAVTAQVRVAAARRRGGGKIRVGIVSGYFRDHSVWKIPTRGWLVGLDRTRFEIVCYHTGTIIDARTHEARGLADRFVEGPASLATWAARIAADACDALLYPEIGMDGTAALLAGLRLAPVQANGLGHPVTSGLPTMDYALSSALMEPDGAEAHYTETLVRLPNLATCYDDAAVRDETATAPPVPSFGLPEASFVFWCGQSLFKYQPRHDDTFVRIARAAPRARFVFIAYSAGGAVTSLFEDRLRRAFARQGLRSEDHCRFLPRLRTAQFAAAAGRCDAILDSIGWAGFNSTLESLARDLPLVTMDGPFMRGRHGAAILRRMGLVETLAATEDDFVAHAVRLASDASFAAARREDIARAKSLLSHDQACMDVLGDWLTIAAGPPGMRS